MPPAKTAGAPPKAAGAHHHTYTTTTTFPTHSDHSHFCTLSAITYKQGSTRCSTCQQVKQVRKCEVCKKDFCHDCSTKAKSEAYAPFLLVTSSVFKDAQSHPVCKAKCLGSLREIRKTLNEPGILPRITMLTHRWGCQNG